MSLKAKFENYVERQLPRVLTQMDRDSDSPTFGCFDRNYWHYKIRDYPSSILQQGIFSLEAIANGNITTIKPNHNIDNWRTGAVNALGRQIDSQGRVDEYYPFESSYPAAAFSLYAICRVLFEWQSHAPHLLDFVDFSPLQRLAHHLAGRIEKQASNQQAAGLAGLAFATKLNLLSQPKITVEEHATRLFNSQHSEGWFDEYGGPDFGYLSVTLDALIDYYDATKDSKALTAIDKAVEFLANLIGADYRLPSTLNSRNTDYVVPYGLVRTAQRNPLAAWLVEVLFSNINQSTHFFWSTDDRYHCHYIFASIVRSLPFLEQMKPGKAPAVRESKWMPGCGFWIYWSDNQQWNAYVAGNKGGLLRIHRQGGLDPIVEYGWRIQKANQIWTSNWWSAQWVITKQQDTIIISGSCHKSKFHIPSPDKHFLLRILAFLGREKVIPLLKKIMIFQPNIVESPSFERLITIGNAGVKIEDKIGSFPGAIAVPSPRQNLRHVASADSFSGEELLPCLLDTQRHSLSQELIINFSWQGEQ
ncbi:MAG: hypothetical protein QNJ47_25245 [Nostocaceae cyanobacterium]|nr:hypothetical protein [Nostocaceae cyanobacterium]